MNSTNTGQDMAHGSNSMNSDIAFDPGLLVDFENCKYKAAQRIKVSDYPSAQSEIAAIQRYRLMRLKERWHPTTNDGYATFNGTLASPADLRALSSNVFGNVRLTYNHLQCDVDGIEKNILMDQRRPTYFPVLIALSTQPSILLIRQSNT